MNQTGQLLSVLRQAVRRSMPQFIVLRMPKEANHGIFHQHNRPIQESMLFVLRPPDQAVGRPAKPFALFGGEKRAAACISMHELRAGPLQRLQPKRFPLCLWMQRMGCLALFGRFTGRGGRASVCLTQTLLPGSRKPRRGRLVCAKSQKVQGGPAPAMEAGRRLPSMAGGCGILPGP